MGELSAEPPRDEPADSYIFDPQTPSVPLAGGLLAVAWLTSGQIRGVRMFWYTPAEIVQETEITGELTLHLYASSSALDADFVAVVVGCASRWIRTKSR